MIGVVYLLIPTSNHNLSFPCVWSYLLYIFWFLHQTTTPFTGSRSGRRLYIFWFLHQTTTGLLCEYCCSRCISFDSYIKPQLQFESNDQELSCISFDSYIKPQLLNAVRPSRIVVYLLIPTSNHNVRCKPPSRRSLYIFWFLHQTTTDIRNLTLWVCCISFDSYIKPQHLEDLPNNCIVVYLLIPTSNHNSLDNWKEITDVVYLLIPTSNHNLLIKIFLLVLLYIFWFLHQTTTHDLPKEGSTLLYIFWFLHQTTTRLSFFSW